MESRKHTTLVTPDLNVEEYEKELQESLAQARVTRDQSRCNYIYIPAGQLQIGDKVLLPKNPNGRRSAVSEANSKEVTVIGIRSSGEVIQWKSSENRTYRMPTLGVHVRIKSRY